MEQLEQQIEGEPLDGGGGDEQQTPRDYEAEARQHGWTDKDAFKGDPAKWVDAETFIKRADEVMPFLKKQNEALKREMAELRKDMKKASTYFSKAEERAYNQALADLEARHTEAVETGDVAASKRIVRELQELEKPEAEAEAKPDPEQARRELNEWIERNDWYLTDEPRRRYADFQAEAMGPATEWPDGNKAWLDELEKRVERKFAEKKPQAVATGGNRPSASRGGKSFADLPPEAKKLCDKWVANGLIKSRDDYVKSYAWD